MNNVLPFDITGGLGIFSVLGVALVVFIVMRVTGIVKPGQSVYQLGRMFQFAAEAPVRLALKPLLWALFKVPGAKRAGDALWSKLTDESLERFFDRMFRNSDNALLRGDIEALARQRYPESRYPHLWMKDIPEDLQRPLVIDGRLPNGASPATLAPTFIDTVLVGQAYRRAVLAGLFWAFMGILLWHPQTYFGKSLATVTEQAENRTTESRMARRAAGPSVAELPYVTMGVQLHEDAWDMETLNAKVREQTDLQGKVMSNRRDAIISSAPGGLVTSLLFGLLVFFGTWRGLVRDAAQQKIEPLRRQNKEAIVQWKYRIPERDVQYRAFLAQLQVVQEFDKSPLIEIGTGSGLFRFRGHLSAPNRGQAMRYSLTDMSQHTLLLGGTGQGKTRTIIIPVVKQLLALRAKSKEGGMTRAISFYCTDGKAVLWRDIKQAADEMGQGGDVRVIGCDEAAGEYGVDLMEGVDPQLLADIIRSVMRQAAANSGASGDDFWPNLASNLIRVCAVIARAWECTSDGLDLISKTGERIYSIVMVYQLALDDELQERAVRAVLDALNDEKQWPYIAEYAGVELMDSIHYLRKSWMELAKDTKTGITANVTSALAPFASNTRLRSAFATGRGKNLMSIADAWGSICLVNVSSLEYGVAGRIVNVALKTLLYTEARKREMLNPKIGLAEKLLFVADEFQDLITADVAGMSDANFWNVARSTGTIGFVSTQGMSSLEQAIGRVAADNFALQMRSKIFLQVEDPATIDYAKKLAGNALRSYTFESDRYESFEGLVRELGENPLESGPARIVELPNNYIGALASGWMQAYKSSLPLTFDTWRAAVDLDLRFVPGGGPFSKTSEESRLSAEGHAYERQQDKTRAYMSEGNHDGEILRNDDMIGMGRAHAYVYLQRAGATRQDLAEIG